MRRKHAVVAQLDRATGYELVGWGFESLRPHILSEAQARANGRAGFTFFDTDAPAGTGS